MNPAIAEAEMAERNRRESFRINDRVAMNVKALSESEFRAVKSAAPEHFQRRRILNGIIATGEAQRGMLRNLRDEDPALGTYLQSLEERLDALARLLSLKETGAPDRPTHDVNISGTGIRFHHDRALTRGGKVQIELQVFPSRTCLSLLGTVVRCQEVDKPSRDGGTFMVAVDFSDIHEDDQELLIRHVHGLQMDYVRRGALRS